MADAGRRKPQKALTARVQPDPMENLPQVRKDSLPPRARSRTQRVPQLRYAGLRSPPARAALPTCRGAQGCRGSDLSELFHRPLSVPPVFPANEMAPRERGHFPSKSLFCLVEPGRIELPTS
jgi:hypothetical protein